jgi:hypothetical protein
MLPEQERAENISHWRNPKEEEKFSYLERLNQSVHDCVNDHEFLSFLNWRIAD